MQVFVGCFLLAMVRDTFQILLPILIINELQSLGGYMVGIFMVHEVKSMPRWLLSLTIAVNFMSFLRKFVLLDKYLV